MPPRSKAFPLEALWPPLLKDLGLRPRNVLQRAGLPTDLFSRSGVSLNPPDFFRLWLTVEAESGDPLFPLRIAENFRPESFHPTIFAALCSTNLSQALQRISRYKRLIGPIQLRINETKETLNIKCVWLDRTITPPNSLILAELVFLVLFARLATREKIQPLRVESCRTPKPSSAYTQFFGTRMHRSNYNALTFSAADAHRPFLTANETMWATFEPTLRKRLAELDETATLEERVRSVLLEALPSGAATMEDVCRRLALGKRTFQRRLQDEGTSFKAIVTATRKDLARHYLLKTKLSGAEIACLLGYENPNSFFRAFHAWTGQTTERVRLEHVKHREIPRLLDS